MHPSCDEKRTVIRVCSVVLMPLALPHVSVRCLRVFSESDINPTAQKKQAGSLVTVSLPDGRTASCARTALGVFPKHIDPPAQNLW